MVSASEISKGRRLRHDDGYAPSGTQAQNPGHSSKITVKFAHDRCSFLTVSFFLPHRNGRNLAGVLKSDDLTLKIHLDQNNGVDHRG
jgi:hypothetical protein